jgi:hypothetical protein
MSEELQLLKKLRSIYTRRAIELLKIPKVNDQYEEYIYYASMLNKRIQTIENCKKYWTDEMLKELNTRRFQ